MNYEVLAAIEHEVLSWPGVNKAIHDELIADAPARPHGGGFPATVNRPEGLVWTFTVPMVLKLGAALGR